MKAGLKKVLARLGWSLNRVPAGIVVGLDLGRDLSLVLEGRRRPALYRCGRKHRAVRRFPQGQPARSGHLRIRAGPRALCAAQSRHGATPGVTLVNAGLGAERGQIEFNIFENQTLNSFLPISESGSSTLGGSKLVRRLPVPVYCLDDYAASAGLARIDLLKVDTQGYELQVLQGAGHLLAAGSVNTVLIEINFAPLYERQVWGHEIMGLLHGYGLHLVDFYEKCRLNPHLGWCTALFTRRAPPPQ